MHPQDIFIKDYTYNLPEGRIARYPLEDRDASRLLVYQPGKINEDIYRNLDTHLPENSLLIFNNTKVVEARLLFQKPTGGVVEIFCLEPHEHYADITTAMGQQGNVLWKCLVGGASKWKRGQVLEKKITSQNETITLYATYKEKRTDHFIIDLTWSPRNLAFAGLLHHAGAVPLPPYIKREAEASDADRYQTIYAYHNGSVAAPTAGLHFTKSIFERLKKKNIQTDFVTLHVGAGTFKPVKTQTIGDHEMHAEFIDVSTATIQKIFQHPDNIIAVGTTSLRTIETLYWLGVKVSLSPGIHDPELTQWEAYGLAEHAIPPAVALNSLMDWMYRKNLERLVTKTQIMIAPGYKVRITRGLITNFHQPDSTLLLLVAALVGDDWKKIYDYALQNDFRFLSYGDGSFLWIPDSFRE